MVKCDNCGKYVKDKYRIKVTTFGNKLFCEECYKLKDVKK